MDLYPLVVDTRSAFADVLDGLDAPQWDEPTLADGWTVREMVAHMTMPLRFSPGRYIVELLRAGGSFDRMAGRVAHRDGARPIGQLAAEYRALIGSRWRPPRAGFEAPLTHDVVHGLDVCRPLGIDWRPSAEATGAVLTHLASPASLKYFHLDLDGLDLRAPDVGWHHGDGAEVGGDGVDLVLALATRPAGVERLAGAGVARLVDLVGVAR